MNEEIFQKIKQDALNEHIPIVMDDTLDIIEKKLKENPPSKMLEIGTATRILINLFFEFFK